MERSKKPGWLSELITKSIKLKEAFFHTFMIALNGIMFLITEKCAVEWQWK